MQCCERSFLLRSWNERSECCEINHKITQANTLDRLALNVDSTISEVFDEVFIASEDFGLQAKFSAFLYIL